MIYLSIYLSTQIYVFLSSLHCWSWSWSCRPCFGTTQQSLCAALAGVEEVGGGEMDASQGNKPLLWTP